ncbi:hypothetical protein BV22DRAFT_1110426 [Leucogyrophana mollusca]|uniref:Uncharacterized protein n=1 Tax=Leucogyrophana mollusca TaxID=85980 RepID=A0ACB8BSM0_9AGAM|nr:hypothetical protein BV22DRAFT_1110426 [Leucogyrophana mollusca]
MFVQGIVTSFVLALVASANAEPIAIQRRVDIGSIIDSATAAAGSYYSEATSLAGSYYSEGTSLAASYYSEGLSAASSGYEEGLSDASTFLHGAATVTSVGGVAVTLATGSAAVMTTIGGSQISVAKPTSNAAVNVRSLGISSSPVLTGLIAVAGGTLFGAWATL